MEIVRLISFHGCMAEKDVMERWVGRARQKALKLINHPDFRKRVLSLRTKYNIPSVGLKTDEENRDWHKWLDAETEHYFNTEWPKHRQRLIDLRESDYPAFKAEEKRLNSLAPLNAFRVDTAKLVHDYNLGPRWRRSLQHYVMFDDIEKMEVPIGVQLEKRFEGDLDQEVLCLIIEENTTLRDVEAIWPRVKYHQASLKYFKERKSQPLRNFERNKRAYELSLEHSSPTKAATALGDELNIVCTITDLYDYVKQHKRAVGIN